MIAVAHYAQVPPQQMKWEKEKTPSAYVVLMRPTKSVVINNAANECRLFFPHSIETSAINFEEAVVAFYKVNSVSRILNQDENRDLSRVQARSQVLAIANYQNDWDGYGAIRPLSECLSHALDIINEEKICLDCLTDIYPNPNGTISFEWEEEDKEIGLEFGSKEFSYYTRFGDHHSYNNKKKYVAEEIGKLAEIVSYMG
jgi:hypothetical protein